MRTRTRRARRLSTDAGPSEEARQKNGCASPSIGWRQGCDPGATARKGAIIFEAVDDRSGSAPATTVDTTPAMIRRRTAPGNRGLTRPVSRPTELGGTLTCDRRGQANCPPLPPQRIEHWKNAADPQRTLATRRRHAHVPRASCGRRHSARSWKRARAGHSAPTRITNSRDFTRPSTWAATAVIMAGRNSAAG